jgi:hypothetical protein
MILTLRRVFDTNDQLPLTVTLHVRASDRRARVSCEFRPLYGPIIFCCLPLNLLTIRRPGSSAFLQLHQRVRRSQESELWANLKFVSIESKAANSLM